MKEKTEKTFTPDSPLEFTSGELTAEDKQRVGQTLYDAIVQSLSDRGNLEDALDDWDDQYEMRIPDTKDHPWPDASNVFVPMTPEKIDTIVARLAEMVFVPRFFLVNPNTPEADKFAHTVERFYNIELYRERWIDAMYECLHLAVKDGLAVMEVRWNKTVATRNVLIDEPVVDPLTGLPVLDPETNEPAVNKVKKSMVMTVHDNVELDPLALKDFLILPSWSYDIEDAPGVAVAKYMTDFQIKELVNSGVFWKDAADKVLSTLSPGQGERAMDMQGTRSAELGGLIEISDNLASGLNEGDKAKLMKGPAKIWQIHTNMIDVDGDDIEEENIFWLHELTQELLGYQRYQYWMGTRPFVGCVLQPRPGRAYGFSMVDRLRTIQAELNAIHNQKNDYISITLSPPMYEVAGVEWEDEDKKWGPTSRAKVNTPQDVGIIGPLPPVPTDAWAEEKSLWEMADRLTGSGDPMSGLVGTSGRRTKAEVQQAAAASGVRLGFMAYRARLFCKQVFDRIHGLKIQYGEDVQKATGQVGGKPEKFEVSKEMLAQDYQLDISGSSGPIDKKQRLDEMMFLYKLATTDPIVAGDYIKHYRFLRMLLEQFDLPDIEGLIGSEEEAVQKGQAMMQQQQAQAPQQQGGKPSNGKPSIGPIGAGSPPGPV